MLHGGGVAGWMWNPTAELLSPRFRLIIPDLPGHDRDVHESYRTHAHTVRELLPLIEAAGGRVTVVGFSLGAQLGVQLAASHPDLIDAVVVISAQAKPTPAPAFVLSMLRAAAPLARFEWFGRLQAKQLYIPASLMDEYLHTSQAITTDTLLAAVGENIRFTIPDGWCDFPGRALILAGSKERGFMKESARRLHDSLRGSELEILNGSGHGIPLERPPWLARRLADWLAAAGD